jgi:uncharacterized protein
LALSNELTLIVSLGTLAFSSVLHCGVMCGPLVAVASTNSKSFWYHQSGRALSYVGLFTFFYSLKSTIGSLASALTPGILLALDLALGLSISLLLALRAFDLLGFAHLIPIPKFRFLDRLRLPHGSSAFWMGISSAFLPCGVLYAAAVIGAQHRSLFPAALSGLLFAAFTSPALLAAWYGQRSLLALLTSPKAKRVTAMLLLLIAGWIATVRMSHYREQSHNPNQAVLLCL